MTTMPTLPTLLNVNREKSEIPGILVGIRNAFELFDEQSSLLQNSFDNLKRNLAEANKKLNDKNRALSEKVIELHEMSGRLHCILESLADSVLVVAPDMTVERCNPAAENLLELGRSEIENKPYCAIMNSLGDAGALQCALDSGATVLDQERIHAAPEGDKIHVLASVSPIRSSKDGQIIGAVEVLRDITQLRMLQERVHHQRRVAALGEMAASVAHEIRNPLGTIEGFARLLKKDLIQNSLDRHSRLAAKIIEGVQNLNYVITNLLNYARPLALQSEPFHAAMLFESVRDLLVDFAKRGKVNLDVQMPKNRTKLCGDVRQLRQVLVNLGRNAIEACPEGGRVQISSQTIKRVAQFIVRDNGCGIAPADLPNIFDPFFTKKEGGTGLGLSLCHKIVQAHNGEIKVNSTVGHGTVFVIAIPQRGDA